MAMASGYLRYPANSTRADPVHATANAPIAGRSHENVFLNNIRQRFTLGPRTVTGARRRGNAFERSGHPGRAAVSREGLSRPGARAVHAQCRLRRAAGLEYA